MLSQGQELAAIDFADIIGGPLIAVINAQAKAAHVTSNFIQEIAFEQSTTGQSQKLRTVSFDFTQVLGSVPEGMADSASIKVPLLSILPIPFIRVDNMTIDFNVNLHDTKKVDLKNDFTFDSKEDAKETSFLGFGPAMSFSASVTDRNTYQNDQMTDDTYSLHVTVHAVQDQMPGGLQQILGIFTNLVQSQSTLLQTIMTNNIQAQQAKLAPPDTGSASDPNAAPAPAPTPPPT